MGRTKRFWIITLGLVGSLVFALNSSETVFAGKAQNVYDYINNKAKYQGVYHCYTEPYSKEHSGQKYEVLGSIPSLDSVKKVSNILWYQNSSFSRYNASGYYNQAYAGTETKRCGNIFGSFEKKPSTGNAESVQKFMEGLGYKLGGASSECYTLPFKKNGSNKTFYTNAICSGSDGYIESGTNDEGARLSVDSSNKQKICLAVKGKTGNKCMDGSTLKRKIDSAVEARCGVSGKCESENNKDNWVQFEPAVKQTKSSKAELNGSRSDAANTAINYLSGDDKKANSIKIDDIEKRLLYQAYLSKHYGAEITCKSENFAEDGAQLKWFTNGEIKTCYYGNAKNPGKAVNGVKDGFLVKNSISNMDALISEMKKLKTNYSDEELSRADEIVGGGALEDEEGSEDGDIEDLCNKAGLKGLSWIACPVMSNTEATVSDLDAMIGSWLAVDTNLYEVDTPTYQVWETMRNIANVALVIVFLVIIFSQLTGVGVNNYGIKKMLPRLVAMAILINLSFLACQIVIDLSNILGVSLNSLFRSVGQSVMPAGANVEEFIADAITGIFAIGGVAGAATPIAVTSATAIAAGGTMAVGVILLALVPILLAVLLFFIMLGARMVLVIVCTAVAPIVCVLYILPNTQKWAKKWWDLFFTMLVMYPICGAIAGVSYLIKAMVLDMEGVHLWMLVVGIIGPYLPFFLLPSLLKGAISMLGNVGGAFMSMGQKVSSGIQTGANAIKDTSAYKNKMKIGSSKINNALLGYDETTGQLTERGRRLAARAQNNPAKQRLLALRMAQADKDRDEMTEAGSKLTSALAASGISETNALSDQNGNTISVLGSGFNEHTEGAYYGRQFLDAAAEGDFSKMDSIIKSMVGSNMKPKDIAKLIRYVEANHLINSDENARADWLGKIYSGYGNDFVSTDEELSHHLRTRGHDDITMNYGEYAAANHLELEDIKPEDIPKLSGDSIAGLAASGKLTQGMAQRVLAMNPNITEEKKIMLSAVASGKATFTNGYNDAEKFKEDAETLAEHHDASVPTIQSDEETVNAWVANNPQEVNVVQNFKAGGRQYDDVNARAELTDSGVFADPAGNTYHVRRSPDGKWLDDGGFEVDIDHMKRVGGYNGNDKP
ncbi:hypothetical protein IKF92_03370 [Candidatus Saccharibacteria bacterium]|nr:hypothetical protein [Candidatus Saccharibacteria bacterium]